MKARLLALAVMIPLFQGAALAAGSGCYQAPSGCLALHSRWGNDGIFYYSLENRCPERLFVTACTERKNGRAECGTDAVRSGGRFKAFAMETTGRVAWEYIGSRIPSEDFICASETGMAGREPSFR